MGRSGQCHVKMSEKKNKGSVASEVWYVTSQELVPNSCVDFLLQCGVNCYHLV